MDKSKLKKIQSDNRLEIIKEDNSKIRKGAFYVNYKEYKEYFNRQAIKLI